MAEHARRGEEEGHSASRGQLGRYLISNGFEAALGLAAAVAGAIYFIDPGSLHDTSTGIALQGLVIMWSALYFFGGLFMVVGLVVASLRVELVGLCLFIPALLTQGVSIMLIAGTRGVSAAATFIAFTVAALLRAKAVWELARSTQAEKGEPWSA